MLKRGNIVMGAFFLIIGLVLLKVAYEPHEMLFADPNALHIMTYPKILIYIWIIASLFYAFGKKDCYTWDDFKKTKFQLLKVLICIGVYAFAFEYLGLFISTVLFLLLFFWVMNYRNKLTVPIALLCAAVTWVCFEKLLGIPMPRPFFLDLF